MFETLRTRLFQLIAYSDTTPTRFFLAFTASLWCFALAWPGDSFDRPVYHEMLGVFGYDHAELKWTVLWGILALGLWWRIFSAKPTPRISLLLNYLSVVLFSISTYSILIVRLHPFPAAAANAIACTVASIWVLVRTHVNSEEGWRID